MSRFIRTIAILISCVALIPGFQCKRSSSSQLIMNAWGAEKVGGVITTSVAKPPQELGCSSTSIRRPSSGNGFDERSPKVLIRSAQDAEIAQLISVDQSLRHLSLMRGLSGGSRGQEENLKRIHVAADVENILPASSVSSMNLASGGLMCDWNFE